VDASRGLNAEPGLVGGDPDVRQPGDGWIGGQCGQHRPVRPKIVSVGSEDGDELVVPAEPGRMPGRVGYAGRRTA
jgi:hypothetical protein